MNDLHTENVTLLKSAVKRIELADEQADATDGKLISIVKRILKPEEESGGKEDILVCPVQRVDSTVEQGELICPVRRTEDAKLDDETEERQLISVVRRTDNSKRAEAKANSARESLKKDKSIFFTKTTMDNDEGVFVEDEDTYCFHNNKRVLLFDGVLYIKKKIRKIDEIFDQYGCVTGQEIRQFFKIELLLDGLIFSDYITLEELYEGRFITELSGGESSLEGGVSEKKLYKKLIKKKIKEREYLTETMYATPGWKNIPRVGWAYVLPTGVVGHPELKIYSDQLKIYGSTRAVYTGSSVARDFLTMRAVLPNKPEIGAVCQYYFMLALMKGLLREMKIPPQFCLAIIGETNSKKTTLANLFFKLYERDCGVDIDFTATKVAIEESMARNADAVTIFDDITPPDSKSSEREMKAKIELLARSFGGNLSKKRSKAYVAANPGASEFTPVLSSGVITGEVFPVALLSSRTRIVKVEINRTDCDLVKLTWHQQLDVLPAFAVDFIEYITRNPKVVMEEFWSTFQSQRLCVQRDFKTPRFAETFAMMYCVTTIFKGYLAEKGISSEEITSLIKQDQELLKLVILRNDQEANQRPDEVMQAECLVKTMHSVNVSEDPLEKLHYKEGFVVVHPQYFQKIVGAYYERNGRVLSYTGNELSKFLHAKGLIKGKEENGKLRFTHKASFIKEANNVRFYYFFKSKIESLAEQGLI